MASIESVIRNSFHAGVNCNNEKLQRKVTLAEKAFLSEREQASDNGTWKNIIEVSGHEASSLNIVLQHILQHIWITCHAVKEKVPSASHEQQMFQMTRWVMKLC